MPVVIGRVEMVDLPEWKVRLRGKVDTGARTSALHVDNIRELPGGWVSFEVILHRAMHRRVEVHARVARRCSVRSSTGQEEPRYFVVTRMTLGPVTRDIEISLAVRTAMRYRMLLGRSALSGDFVIDPGRRYVATSRRTSDPKKSTARRLP